jgi:hypothetical protein
MGMVVRDMMHRFGDIDGALADALDVLGRKTDGGCTSRLKGLRMSQMGQTLPVGFAPLPPSMSVVAPRATIQGASAK